IKTGVEVTEASILDKDNTSRQPPSIHAFSPVGEFKITEGGQLRGGFDGRFFWAAQQLSGTIRTDQFTEEKLSGPELIRSFAWLRDKFEGTRELWECGQGDARRVVVSLSKPNGIVPVRIFLNPQTWLPERGEVEWDAESFTVMLDDYRTVLGFQYPHRITTSYRGRTSAQTVIKVEEIHDRAYFQAPRQPWQVQFDDTAPAT